MMRRHVDLKVLPLWQQYVIALVITAVVVLAALTIGRPGPSWLTAYLIPIWRFVGVIVLFGFILSWLARRLRA